MAQVDARTSKIQNCVVSEVKIMNEQFSVGSCVIWTEDDEKRLDTVILNKHLRKLDDQEKLKVLVKKFLYYLDIEEESDDGKKFHPTAITSCRAMDAFNLDEILGKMRELVKDK